MKPLLTREIASNLFELLVWFSNNPQEDSRMGLAKEHVLRMTTNLLKLYEYETGFLQEGKMTQILEKIAREGVPKSAQEKVQQAPPAKVKSWQKTQKTLETFQKWQGLAKKAETTQLLPEEQVQVILTARDVERDVERAEEDRVGASREEQEIPEQATPVRAVRPVLAPEEPDTGEQEVPAPRPGAGQRPSRQRLLYLLVRPRSLRGKLTDQIRNILPLLPKPPDRERVAQEALAKLREESPETFRSVQGSLGPRLGEVLQQAKARVGAIGEASLIPSKERLQEVTSGLSARAVRKLNLFALRLNEETGALALSWAPQDLASAVPVRVPSFSFQRILLRFWVRVLEPVLILPRFRWLRLSIGGGAFLASFIPLPLPAQVLGPVQAGLRAGGGGSLATEGLRAPGLRALGGGALRKGAAVAARSLAAISTGVAAALSALWPVLVVVVAIVVVALPLYLLFTHSSETTTVAETGGPTEFIGLPPGFESPPALAVEDIKFALPTRPEDGQICLTQPFSTTHSGVDFKAAMGRKIYSIADGVVFGIGKGWPYGYHVVILTTGKKGEETIPIYHLYAHLNQIKSEVIPGVRVTTESVLGWADATGNTDGGDHLHLSVSNICGTTAGDNCFWPVSPDPCSYLSCPAECSP